MKSMTLLFVIFGGILVITSVINAAKLTYYDTARYQSNWGMTADWYIAARKEGWLRDGRKSNLWSALIGAVIFSLGMCVWGWSPLSTREQDVLLLVSVLAFILGLAGALVEDGYSVTCKTMRWAGLVGTITAITMIAGS